MASAIDPAQLEACGQRCLAAHVRGLGGAERSKLLAHLQDVDLLELRRIFQASTASPPPAAAATPLLPGDVVSLQSRTAAQCEEWTRTGWRLLAEGKAAVLLLAGGQGTRLGSATPKGCYDIGLPSHKSLFQLQAERLRRLQRLASEAAGRVVEPVMWYIMTSPMTHGETLAHFEAHDHFGLQRSQIFFFQQGTLPCLTPDGEVILASNTEVATAPDGNGGVYLALLKSGALQDMRARGIECLDCYCVDNALVRLGDPLFLGCCFQRGAECGARVVRKAHAQEKVGVFARRSDSIEVVEYSELDPSEACSCDAATGELKFSWSNVCMHYFQVDWLAEVATRLREAATYHIARKQVPSKDGPVAGIKLEQFIFDPFPMARSVALVEVRRDEEFSPVKNAPGAGSVDSPDSARAHVLALHRRWVEAAGATVAYAEGVEVSPLVSYAGEGLERVCCNLVISTAFVAALQEECV